MIVNTQFTRAIKELGPEIIGCDQRHVALVAVVDRVGWIIEASCSVSRYSAEQVVVVVVLPTQEFFVVSQFSRQVHFVAGGTEFSGLVKRLQEGFLVE